ncbi:MAG TPA: hypothetical protein ENK91_17235 [Bacteroidetes bacterium]|nr:hypothetical protein [Bacteroidota bacterium]
MLTKFKPKSEFSRNVLTLMTGTSIAQAIPIAISPILTRIYTPEDFGVFAFFVAMVSLLGVIMTARYEQAILLAKDDKEAMDVLTLGFVIALLMLILLTVLVIVIEENLFEFLSFKSLGFWLYLVPLAAFLMSFFNLIKSFSNRRKQYKEIANAVIIKAVVISMVQIVAGFLKVGVGGLIFGQVLSQLFGNLRLAIIIIKEKTFFRDINVSTMWKIAKKYKNFPLYQMPHAFLNVFSISIPILFFSSFFSLGVVGFYSLATKILLVPLMLIANASATVYNQKVSELYRQGNDVYHFTLTFLLSLMKKIALIFIPIVIFAPHLFSYIFGEAWSQAGVYTQILSPYIFLNAIVSSVIYITSLLGKQRKAFLVSIVHLVLSSIALSIGVFYESVYLSLLLYVICTVGILMYNLFWMLGELKRIKA